MFISIRRGTRLAAVVGLSAAVVIGLAGPASAAPVPGNNSATGIEAEGLIDAGPFSEAFFPNGPVTDTLASVDVEDLVSSGTLVTNASATTADASVEDLDVRLSRLLSLSADAVTSQCSYDEDSMSLSGDSAIVGGAIESRVPLVPDVALDASAAPNTTIDLVVAEITLNRQTTAPDGSLTVDAIFIDLLDGTQTVTIASSTCRPAVLVVPVIAPQFAAGAGVLGLLVLGFFLYRRRHSSAVVAQV